MTINKGDVVKLKSGGPWMTVKWTENRHGEDVALCEWFTTDGVNHSEVFGLEQLELKGADQKQK